jgi:hypothetical protein
MIKEENIKMKISKIMLYLFLIIILLFLTISIHNAELIKNQYFIDDTITIDPQNPNGDHGWYITPVEITFHAYDPPVGSSGLYCIKYRIIVVGGEEELEWQTHYIDYYCTEYNYSILLSVDGIYIIEFYAIDGYLAGKPLNDGYIHTSQQIKIDMTKPISDIISPTKGFLYFDGNKMFEIPSERTIIIRDITIEATANDITSGIFYIHFDIEEYESDDTTEPYTFDFQRFYIIPTACQLTISCRDIAGNIADDLSMTFIKWL